MAEHSSGSGRALVVIAREPTEAPSSRIVRRQANFIAHLIATAQQLPQVRERRRADPAEVIAAYRSNMARVGGR